MARPKAMDGLDRNRKPAIERVSSNQYNTDELSTKLKVSAHEQLRDLNSLTLYSCRYCIDLSRYRCHRASHAASHMCDFIIISVARQVCVCRVDDVGGVNCPTVSFNLIAK